MKHVFLLPVLLVLAVGAAAADGSDAETRFHEAYVQEVIEGDIAGAARTYLALLEDDATPLRIHAQSRLRFAVCTVLLGRADEARAQLAALLADETTPESVRVKAEEYKVSIAALGAGSELEKKLQSLVFDLGRADVEGDVPAYRDFEIIGDRAVPFLKELLSHRDERLRRHAFRLLCRMGVDDAIASWTPEIRVGGTTFCHDFGRYLGARPEAQAVFEEKLLALEDERLGGVLDGLALRPPVSAAFVGALVARPAIRNRGLGLLHLVPDVEARRALVRSWLGQGDLEFTRKVAKVLLRIPGILADEAESRRLLVSWLRAADAELRKLAAYHVLRHGNRDPLPAPVEPDLYGRLVEYARDRGGMWYRDDKPVSLARGLAEHSDAQGPAALLAALRTVVTLGTTAGEDGTYRRRTVLTLGLADLIATSLERHPPSKIDLAGYAEVLKQWASVYPAAFVLDKSQHYVPSYPSDQHLRHLRWLFPRLGPDEAGAMARWVVGETERQRKTELGDRARHYLQVLQIDTPDAVGRWRSAYAAAVDEEVREWLLDLVPFGQAKITPETTREILKLLPELVPTLGVDRVRSLAHGLVRVSQDLDPDDAAAAAAALLRSVAGRDAEVRDGVCKILSTFQWQQGASSPQRAFVVRVWPRVLDRLLPTLSPEDREHCLRSTWSSAGNFRAGDLDAQPELVSVLRDHLGEPGTQWPVVAIHPKVFPYADWVPLAPEEIFTQARYRPIQGAQVVEPEEIDRVARALTREPEKVNSTVLAFVRQRATLETRMEILNHLLAAGGPGLRRLILPSLRMGRRGAYPQLAPGLEAMLDDLLAEERPDLAELRQVATLLEPLKPTKKLLPAARLLLASSAREDVLAGIGLAGALAQAELLDALRQIYVSTLDSRIRAGARKAMDTIEDLERVRQGKKPR